jgi:hypothetical protein
MVKSPFVGRGQGQWFCLKKYVLLNPKHESRDPAGFKFRIFPRGIYLRSSHLRAWPLKAEGDTAT